MKTIYWKIIGCFLAVFIAGGAVGGALVIGMLQHRLRQLVQPDQLMVYALQQLDHTLHLTAEQHHQIEGILTESKPQWITLNQRQREERWALVEETKSKISVLLTPTQSAQLNALCQQRRERIQRFLGIRPPPA